MSGRKVGIGKIGHGKVTPPSDRTYGDSAEIEGRDVGPGSHPSPTAFKQIGPEDGGGDASNPSFKKLSSDIKYSRGLPD